MRILYSAGNRLSSGIQTFRIVNKLQQKHKVKVASYYNDYITFADWCLNAVSSKYGRIIVEENIFGPGFPKVNIKNAKVLLNDIEEWEPDLIISDAEPILAHIASMLKVRLWYCSPLFIEMAYPWAGGGKRFSDDLKNINNVLRVLPEAERIFIYTPFILPFRIGYEQITPYYETTENKTNEIYNLITYLDKKRIKNALSLSLRDDIKLCCPNKKNKYKDEILNANACLFDGNSSYLTDFIYNKKKFSISYSVDDPETLLNAAMCELFKYSKVLGRVEVCEDYIKIMEEEFNKETPKYNMAPTRFLHEEIDKLENVEEEVLTV